MGSEISIKNRDHARLLIAEHGITTDNISEAQLCSLGHYIDLAMMNYVGMFHDFRMHNHRSKFMTCCCTQWNDREAISFNRDGFIGIAGWASDSNVMPILAGIARWIENEFIEEVK